jgi:replicative superfamily II helicase
MDEKEIIKKVLEISGFKELNPVQKKAVEKGLLRGKNLVISAPTASGKTLCAEAAALKTILEKKGKVVYLVPLVALANEKYKDFKEKYSRLGIKVALSVGDFDSVDIWLQRYDWIVTSNEKCDSLIRHGAPWLNDVGLVVADEIHLLTDTSRGPTLEILLTKLRDILPHAQFLALSATISNAKEIAEWLNAELVKSDWRPVKLYEGVAYDSKIRFLEREGYELSEELPIEDAITENVLKLKKQALFFVATRKSAEALAERLGKVVRNFLGKNEKKLLNELSDRVKNVLEVPTKQCKRLAKCVKNGTAFHHSGLLFKQRCLIEDNFREGLIKVLAATPSLSFGVNLPSFRVIIRDLKRYYPGFGAVFIPVLEVHQMLGRCVSGDAVIYTKNGITTINELASKYFLPNEVGEKIMKDPVYILSLDLKTFTPTFSKVIKISKRKVNKIWEIETKSGKRIRLTSDHEVLTFRKLPTGKPSLCKNDNLSLWKKVMNLREKKGWGPIKIAKFLKTNRVNTIKHWLYEKSKPKIGCLQWKKVGKLNVGKSFKDTDHVSTIVDFHFTLNSNKKFSRVGHIHPDLIKKISQIKKETYVFDLTLEQHHNFVANGIIIHNCGRPAYDLWGEGILLAKNEDEAEEFIEHYILGEPEEITSKLAVEPVLRMHELALIATTVRREESLLNFFSKTFYAHQYHDMSLLQDKIMEVLDKLIDWKFVIKENGRLKPTRIGKRVSELYIDPLTAHNFIEGLKATKQKKLTTLSFLQLISNTLEMRPLLNVRTGEFSELNEVIALHEKEFLQEVPEEWDLEYDDFLRSVKTALMFEDWINEMTEDDILSKYKVTPGELYGRLTNADWLLYALHELALLLGFKEELKHIRKLRIRMQYGVKEELLPLVKLRQIGRYRARKLYNAGLTSLEKLRKIPLESLAHIIGPKIAFNIKEQLGEKVKKPKEERQKTLI